MKRTTLIAVTCAVLIAATGFAAAAPGTAPVSVDSSADDADDRRANDHATADHADGNAEHRENGAAADSGADASTGQGPSGDLPEQVPDHVSAIHDRVSAFLSGGLDGSLGDAISSVTPDDDETATDDANVDGDERSDVAEQPDSEGEQSDDNRPESTEGDE
ncbi:hypothetical protein [Natrinema gari]|uniref:Uncharacterized protein n=1 Tax=Natrinema gari JCM 14663 TaxID=1230459 RepID=L9Z1B1_9EURY|nr:hypothetical protein [Natrinema gari]ELY79467.1 hypothetical protein C486_10719 [Natrinema gari JCM 14663]